MTENGFRRSLLACTSSLLELLTQCVKLAAVQGHRAFTNPSTTAVPMILSWSDDQLKSLCLVLVKGGAFPNIEIAVPAVLAMGALGQRDFQLRDACGAAGVVGVGSGPLGLLSPVLNGLLTNAILRRLQDPNAYASDTRQQDKQLRLLEGGMQLMDSCFNSLIDLHTSDDPTFLANYSKLQCASRLSERGGVFAQKLSASAEAKLDKNDLEKFSETLENVKAFVAYKANFVK